LAARIGLASASSRLRGGAEALKDCPAAGRYTNSGSRNITRSVIE